MRSILAPAAFLAAVTLYACDNPVKPEEMSWQLVDVHDAARISAHLSTRVFRQSDPSRNADSRKTIVIDFHGGVGLSVRAQRYDGGRAVDDWRVSQDFYWMEKAHGLPVYRFDMRNPTVERTLPKECDEGEDCIDTTGLSVLVRDYHRKEEIQFAFWDSIGHLPAPFPVFTSWTRFVEDDTGR